MLNWMYPLILWFALPLVWIRLQWRGRRDPDYKPRQSERFGKVPQDIKPGPIWFHTVSAGESIAASGLIRELVAANPEAHFLVTTMTPTGSAQVLERLGDVAQHCYAPYDFSFAVRRFYTAVKPRMLVLMETELWPNLIRHAHDADIPVVLINARLSERSARGYARIGSITTTMLARMRLIACQGQDHAERFTGLGLGADQVRVVGNVKYDLALPQNIAVSVERLGNQLGIGSGPVWIAASTHPGEDEVVLAAHEVVRSEIPEAQLILVPRHPHRADEVAKLVAHRGWSQQRQSEAGGARADVVIGDVMGSLLALYGLADCAFVGGSLVAIGGHNPIEPALFELPVITGPEQFNFADAYMQMGDSGAAVTVDNAQDLGALVATYLSDKAAAEAAGNAAAQVVAANKGATQRTRALLQEMIQSL
ncbi:MAG: lipid IV(A) 3-deoxy-D-manno-octulosonic acid transferase [Pseudomonadota bacterium]